MKAKRIAPVMRGLSAVMASVLALSVVGTGIAETYRTALDDFLGTSSYVTITDEDSARFKSDYATVEELTAAARDIAVREGEEGTVILKNDNDALPMSSGSNVALFGLAAYDLAGSQAGNSDSVDLEAALTAAGFTVNQDLKNWYLNNIILYAEQEVTDRRGNVSVKTVATNMYATPGDFTDFPVVEIAPDTWSTEWGVPENWRDSIPSDSIGIVVFARTGGEGNTYKPGSALDSKGNPTGKDPLELSDEELAVVDAAKETCSKVIVLLNSGYSMMIGAIAEGGEHEVDGIAYIGMPNDYQCEGIVNVLTGKVNSTGALANSFVRDHQSIPAVQNLGGDYFSDYEIVGRDDDPRYPGVEISNTTAGSFGGVTTYNGGHYIVEAEGIYVGYKYYETRYFDSVMGQGNADSGAGSTQGGNWDYSNEMIYTFGYGLSYLDYTQALKSVDVDRSPDGNITAVVEIKNNSDQDGKFLAQLYVQQPYTDYDKQNLVEKSAVMFLTSGKVDVAAGQTAEVTLTVPSKYLASYDANGAGTYILDAGDYLFTAAAGAHAAANNFLNHLGKTGDGTTDIGAVVTWNLNSLDKTTFSIQNGYPVANVADDADLNYWLPDTVTYLTRQDWNTFPINYNTLDLKIADSPKADEWISEMRGETYTLQDTGAAVEAVPGPKFSSAEIGAEQLNNIDDPFWDDLVHAITIDEAVGAVIHGGSRSDTLTNIDNPVVIQNEGPTGISAGYTDDNGTPEDESDDKTYKFNVNSQTLLGCTFNPELAYEWGLVEGNSCLWVDRYDLWGSALTLNRTPYNGRNSEYLSEDAMLTNILGRQVIQGCSDKGIINGPKHMGFNDQEYNRAGISVYMTEQKFRETDLRGFEGALCDADGMGVMIAFNRIGATNASHHVGMIQDIMRGEWAFTGLISTDMMNNSYYFDAASMVMAGITQVADFAAENSHINMGEGGVDAVWPYISLETVQNDSALVEQARENLKYQLYTFANSAILNISTEKVPTWWDNALSTATYVSGALAVITAAAWLILTVVPEKKKEEV